MAKEGSGAEFYHKRPGGDQLQIDISRCLPVGASRWSEAQLREYWAQQDALKAVHVEPVPAEPEGSLEPNTVLVLPQAEPAPLAA